jgi:DNA-directed RNA polymerase subunit RPC12/RpoP
MIAQCDNCGAPLHVDDAGQEVVRCRYCGVSSRVRSMKTLSAVTPPGWAPPSQWTEADRAKLTKGVVVVTAASVGMSAVIAMATGAAVLVAMIGAGVAVYIATQGGSAGDTSAGPRGAAWDGSAPFECGGREVVRIEGVTASLPGQTAITVRDRCRVEVVGSRIVAAQAVRAEGHSEVVVRGSVLETTGAAVWVRGHRRVTLEDTQVVARGAAVDAGDYARVTITGGRVEGSPQAVVTSGRARVASR